jgi:hypothetical protein
MKKGENEKMNGHPVKVLTEEVKIIKQNIEKQVKFIQT